MLQDLPWGDSTCAHIVSLPRIEADKAVLIIGVFTSEHWACHVSAAIFVLSQSLTARACSELRHIDDIVHCDKGACSKNFILVNLNVAVTVSANLHRGTFPRLCAPETEIRVFAPGTPDSIRLQGLRLDNTSFAVWTLLSAELSK